MILVALLVALAVVAWPQRGPRARSPSVVGNGGSTRHPRGRPRVGWSVRRRWRPAERGDWVAEIAEVTAVGLEAGLDLDRAVTLALGSPGVRRAVPELAARSPSLTEDPPVVDTLRGLVRGDRGASVTSDEAGDLGLLLSAWRLSEETGTAAAALTREVARTVRERRSAADRRAVATAGPRASMALLTSLPLLGPVGGAVAGFGPSRLYATADARAAAAVGLALTLAGWWWSRRMLRRAARAARTTGETGS